MISSTIYFDIIFTDDMCIIFPIFWEIFGEYCAAIVRKYSYYSNRFMDYYGGITTDYYYDNDDDS